MPGSWLAHGAVAGVATLAYPEGTFLPIAIATHGLIGLTLGSVAAERPVAGLAGGLAADVDFLFPAMLGWPFVHRGITHSLPILAVAALVAARDRRAGWAVGLAYASHLLVDVTTPKGVPLVYPVVADRLYLDLGIGGHAPVVTLVVWTACLAVLAVRGGVPSMPTAGRN